MERLQLFYDTWSRPIADGLFDYQEQTNIKTGALQIEKSGLIYRQKDHYDLAFQNSNFKQQNYQPILKIVKKQRSFMMQTLDTVYEPLCKLITYDISGIHIIKKSDKLKMGKVQVNVLDLSFQQKIYPSHYEQIQHQIQAAKLQSIRQITLSFYKPEEDSKIFQQSHYEDNPSCRYCYSKTVTSTNPFLVSCQCKGSSRYIHEDCLMQWVLKRGHLQEIKGKGIFYADSKIFKCELCHNFFYIPEFWKKIYHHQVKTLQNLTDPIFDQTLILQFKYQSQFLYFINLGQNRTISIGRSLDNQIIINQLSVSRQHAFLLINSKQKIVGLRDNNSKFGTLELLKSIEIQQNQIYQVGRSKISFKKKKKKGFFQKIGAFCFVQEKLDKQKKKILFDLTPFEKV